MAPLEDLRIVIPAGSALLVVGYGSLCCDAAHGLGETAQVPVAKMPALQKRCTVLTSQPYSL